MGKEFVTWREPSRSRPRRRPCADWRETSLECFMIFETTRASSWTAARGILASTSTSLRRAEGTGSCVRTWGAGEADWAGKVAARRAAIVVDI
jgi:hypothetical protein